MPKFTRAFAAVSLATVIACLCLPGTAHAQRRRGQGASLPQPFLQSIFPPSVTAGESAAVTLEGADLEGVNTLWFDHPGLRAFHRGGSKFLVVCATGVPPGHHDVRVFGPFGLSNPRVLVVNPRGTAREGIEIDPNDSPASATPITIGSVISGKIGPADIDCFSFEGKRGQRVVLEVEAERIDSRLDATIRLLDAQGRDLAEARDDQGLDPVLDVVLPADGRYFAKVHDVTFGGSATDHPYRLRISDGPHVEAVLPTVVKPGVATEVTFFGTNLGAGAATELLSDGRRLERKTVEITAPPLLESGPDEPARSRLSAASSVRRGFEVRLETDHGASNPMFLALATEPIVVDTEPNDGGEHAQRIDLPREISGTFGSGVPGDIDVYRFQAKKGDTWWFEAFAERLGSPADPVFIIQKVGDKGATTDLATGEDTIDRGGQARFDTATVDAALSWKVPDDGTYQVAISDLYASQRGDVRLRYRLQIRRERPDFQLFVLPDSPNQPDAVTVAAGGRSLAYVLACRSDGFAGPIRVEALELPRGVKVEPVVIPAGLSLAPVVFEADAAATPTVGAARLVGRARFGDRKDEVALGAGAPSLGPDITHEAEGGGVVWPSGAAQPQRGNSRVTRGFVVGVTGPAPLAITARPRSTTTTPGGLVALDLSLTRREGFAEAVTVNLLLPSLLPNAPPAVTIPKEATTGAFTFNLPRLAKTGPYTIVFQATGQYPFSKDPAAKSKPNVALNEPSNPVTLSIRTAPANVALGTKGGNVKVGGSLEIDVTVTPQEKAPGPFPVELVAPAALELSAKPTTVEPGKAGKLVIQATAKSPPGAVAGAAIRVVVPVRGEPVEMFEPLTLTIVK